MSRRERFEAEEGDEPDHRLVLPWIDVGAHLVDYLFAVGPAVGGEVITHTEIRNWMELTGHRLEPWEVSLLRQLSGAYLDEFHLAGSEDRKMPEGPEGPKRRLSTDEVEAKLDALFEGFAAAGFAAPSS